MSALLVSIPIRILLLLHELTDSVPGTQGGSVARTLLNYPEKYHVRAITRDASKPKAQELAKLGAELVTADLKDHTSIQEALKGAYGVFAMTDHWAQPITEWGQSDEADIGIALAIAAKVIPAFGLC